MADMTPKVGTFADRFGEWDETLDLTPSQDQNNPYTWGLPEALSGDKEDPELSGESYFIPPTARATAHEIDPEAAEVEQARQQAAIKAARGVRAPGRGGAGTPKELAPRPQTLEEYEAIPPGTEWVNPDGQLLTKPYEPHSLDEYRRIPEGKDWRDPDGNVKTKPVYGDISFSAQSIYNMTLTNEEKRKTLEKFYPKRVYQEEGTGDFYVEDEEGNQLKPRGFMKNPIPFLAGTAAPTIGATVGDIVGSVGGSVVPGVGTFAGGVGGATIGGTIGQSFNDIFLKMLGIYDRTLGEEAIGLGVAGLLSGTGSAFGQVVGGSTAALKQGSKKLLTDPKGAAGAVLGPALGVDEEGLQIAGEMLRKGAKDVPPSLFLKEAPMVINVAESYEAGFKSWDPYRKAAIDYMEKQARAIMKKIGVSEADIEATVGKLTAPEAEVPTKEAGEKILASTKIKDRITNINKRIVELEYEIEGAKGEGRKFTDKLAKLRETEQEAREAAEEYYQKVVFPEIERTVEEAYQQAQVGGNSGALWERVAGMFQEAKRTKMGEARVQYGRWSQKYGSIEAPGSADLWEAAQNFMMLLRSDDKAWKIFQARYPQAIRSLAKLGGAYDDAGNLVSPPVKATLDDLHQIRSMLRTDINWDLLAPELVNGMGKYFDGLITRTMAGVEESGPQAAAAKALKFIDDWYRRSVGVFRERELGAVLKGLRGGEPADPKVLYNTLIKEGRSDLIKRIEELVGPQLWSAIRAADMEAMIAESRTLQEGILDGRKFINEVLKRERDGLLDAVYGKDAAASFRKLAQGLEQIEGKLPISLDPKDKVPDIIKKIRIANDAAEAFAKTDPIPALKIELQAERDEYQKLLSSNLGFLYEPTTGAQKAVTEILKKPDLIYAAESLFGRNSPEFQAIQQVWVQRVLQSDLDPLKAWGDKNAIQIQKALVPDIAWDDMKALVREMHAVMQTQAMHGDTARGMSTQSRITHPAQQFSMLGKVAKTPFAGVPLRFLLSGWYGLYRHIGSSRLFHEILNRGLGPGATPAARAAARALIKRDIMRWTRAGGAAGAGFAEEQYQSTRQELAEPPLERFAEGGVSSGGRALVGERGPEIVDLPAGAEVTPLQGTERLAQGITDVEENVLSFMKGGLHGVAKQHGVPMGETADKTAAFLQNPDLNVAFGMAVPGSGLKRYLPNEDVLIKQWAAGGRKINEIPPELSHRSYGSLRKRADTLELNTPEEKQANLVTKKVVDHERTPELLDKYADRVEAVKKNVGAQSYREGSLPVSKEEMDLFKDLLGEGLSVPQIQRDFLPHRSKDTLYLRIRTNNFEPTPGMGEINPAKRSLGIDIDELKQSIAAGLTYSQMAEKFGTNRNTIAQLIHVNKLGRGASRNPAGRAGGGAISEEEKAAQSMTHQPSKPKLKAQEEAFTETAEDIKYRKSLGFEGLVPPVKGGRKDEEWSPKEDAALKRWILDPEADLFEIPKGLTHRDERAIFERALKLLEQR